MQDTQQVYKKPWYSLDVIKRETLVVCMFCILFLTDKGQILPATENGKLWIKIISWTDK